MSSGETLALGALAGLTIFLGLPLGRLREPMPRTRAFLNALAIGILTFLLWDVLSHANEPVEDALRAAVDGKDSWWRFAGLAATALAGLGVGLIGLVYYDRWTARRPRPARVGPGAAAAGAIPMGWAPSLSPARRLALYIALGIGLHNFSEGLSIGQSAARGELSLALVLIIGFGLHNATEGFGIVAPLSVEDEPPSWAFLSVMGLIGGGPTFVGTLIGQSFVSIWLFLAFLALAAGSILYVVVQLLHVAQRLGHRELLMWGLFAGLVAGFATDFVLVAAGV